MEAGARIFCSHCDEYQSARTYRRHKASFFKNGVWLKQASSKIEENPLQSSKSLNDPLEIVDHTMLSDDDFAEGANGTDSSESEDAGSDINGEVSSANDDAGSDSDGEEVWDDSALPPEDDFIIRPREDTRIMPMAIQYTVFALLIWQTKFSISDSACEALLGIFRLMLCVVQVFINSEVLKSVLDNFPTSLYLIRKRLGIERDNFEKFVVCSKCSKLYLYDQCWKYGTGKVKQSKTCSNVLYPNHPHRSKRSPCGAKLLKKVHRGNNSFLYPIKVFSFSSVADALQQMISRPGFIEKLHRSPNFDRNGLSDIYDGRLWKEFRDKDGSLFFTNKRHLGVMLNIDWFNPYKNSEYSLGVVYLAILNLPREERFKWDNIITIGIIPGPKEPETHVNSFLNPLVDELLEFWEGKAMKEPSKWIALDPIYRIALLGISSDIPATRKCCGFVGHNGLRGCSKCFREFPRQFGEQGDYSGFAGNFPARDNSLQKSIAQKWLVAKTKSQQKEIERDYGVRYTALYRLPYFNPLRMHAIDPMHNLYLGTAKHVFLMWVEFGILDENKLSKIDERLRQLSLPTDIGRIPNGMTKTYKHLTAYEWKNWTLIFSCFCLKDVLPDVHYSMWSAFVSGCRSISKRRVTHREIADSQNCFRFFGEKFENLFGKDRCTPNMHLHMHLSECILDFGPVYSFWCFSFERFNGILGRYATNNHSISIQIMRKLLSQQQLQGSCDLFTNPIYSKYVSHLERVDATEINVASLEDLFCVHDKRNITAIDLQISGVERILSVQKRCLLDDQDHQDIEFVFRKLFGIDDLRIARFANEVSRVELAHEVIYSKKYKRANSNLCVMARWLGAEVDLESPIIRPAIVNKMYVIRLLNKNQESSNHIVANLSWFRRQDDYYHYFGVNSTSKVWSTEYENHSPASFLPIKLITQRAVFIKEQRKFNGLQLDVSNVVIGLPR